MKQRTLLFSLLMVFFSTPVTAQISFDESAIEDLIGQQVQGSVYLMDVQDHASLTAIRNATGGGQTYDFTPFTYGFPTGFMYEVLPSAAGTPGAGDPDFDSANWVQKQNTGGEFYTYSILNSNGFYLLGSIFVQATDIDGNGVLDQQISKNDPPDEQYVFPITDGTSWNYAYVSTAEGFGATSQATITVENVVEGWGTLVTPIGSAPSLRIRKTLTSESVGQGYTTLTYLFITEQGLDASIIHDDQGTVLSASYSMTTGSGGGGGGDPTAVEEEPEHAFRLAQNYPNPFSNSTSISFDLERPGHVSLRVFDLMGREVAGLVDAHLPLGSYTKDFGAEGLPSGVYLYRLQVDGTVSMRQLIVRK